MRIIKNIAKINFFKSNMSLKKLRKKDIFLIYNIFINKIFKKNNKSNKYLNINEKGKQTKSKKRI